MLGDHGEGKPRPSARSDDAVEKRLRVQTLRAKVGQSRNVSEKKVLKAADRDIRVALELEVKDPTAAIRRLRRSWRALKAVRRKRRKRVVNTLRRWGITVDEVFFLGGVQKKRVLEIFRPHLFFDDQQYHLKPVAKSLPCVHVPFGVVNK